MARNEHLLVWVTALTCVLLFMVTPAEASECEVAPTGMSCIQGGEFMIGWDGNVHPDCNQHSFQKRRRSNTVGEHRVTLSTFFMDQYEVTNQAYQACVRARKCRKAGPNYRDFKRPNVPVTGVSWFDAVAYCKAQGKHLPTESEWEAAARGPEGALYPWKGGPATCANSVIQDPGKGRSCGVRKKWGSPKKGRVLEVGSRPAGRYGLFDMIGNAEEWTADWYTDDWNECGEDCLGQDPKGPCSGANDCKGRRYRTVKGGSWYWPAEHATAVHRRPHRPSNKPFHHFGFRCAATLEEARRLSSNGEALVD